MNMNIPKPYQGNEKFIFISYSHKDTAKVFPIIFKLMENGYRVWYDQGIDPGSEWDENIATHIDTCGYFVAFISSNYLASSNCKDELNYARDLEKDRLVVYLEEVKLPAGMAMRVNRLQSIFKYTYPNEDSFYEKLFTASNINTCRGEGTVKTTAEPFKATENANNEPVITPPANSSANAGAPINPPYSIPTPPTPPFPYVPTDGAKKKKNGKAIVIALIILAVVIIAGIIIGVVSSDDEYDDYNSDYSDDYNNDVEYDSSFGATTFEMTDEDGLTSTQTFYYEDDIVYELVDSAAMYLDEGTTDEDVEYLVEELEIEFADALELSFCELVYSYDPSTYLFTLTITSKELDNADNINALINAGVLEAEIDQDLISFQLSKEALLAEGYEIVYDSNNN